MPAFGLSADESMTWPTITVALPSRNRPIDVARCLKSLSHVEYPHWDILVIDQSDGDETREIAERFQDQLPCLRYHRMPEKGLTRGRNLALRSAHGEILAFIDDDCTVEPCWLQDVATAFVRHPEVPLIFGQVRPVPHDPKRCFIPGHEIAKERILRSRLAFLQAGSIMGASMYLRRAICRQLGPFDVHAGPGAKFNIEDRDYAYRHLTAGYPILLTPRITVAHYGARYYAHTGTRALLRSYGYGFGAQDMKFLRSGDRAVPFIIIGHIIKMLLFIIWPRLLSGRVRGSHGMWIVMYLRGLLAGLRVSVMGGLGLWGRIEDYDADDFPWLGTPDHVYPWRGRRGRRSRRAQRGKNRREDSPEVAQGGQSVE